MQKCPGNSLTAQQCSNSPPREPQKWGKQQEWHPSTAISMTFSPIHHSDLFPNQLKSLQLLLCRQPPQYFGLRLCTEWMAQIRAIQDQSWAAFLCSFQVKLSPVAPHEMLTGHVAVTGKAATKSIHLRDMSLPMVLLAFHVTEAARRIQLVISEALLAAAISLNSCNDKLVALSGSCCCNTWVAHCSR